MDFAEDQIAKIKSAVSELKDDSTKDSRSRESEEERKTVDTSSTTNENERKGEERKDGEYVSLQEQPAQGETKVDLTHNDSFI